MLSESSWKWQLKKLIRDLAGVKDILDGCVNELHKVTDVYPFCVTPYYFDIAKENKSLLKMIIPDIREISPVQNMYSYDPFREEERSFLGRVVHRYRDRVLIIVTNVCPVLCRFCMRKRNWLKPAFFISPGEIDEVINYVASNPMVRDVLISGGDPLMLGVDLLYMLLGGLSVLEHVDVIRIGTRIPVVLPQRIDDELIDVLKLFDKVWINVHVNHPAEITSEVASALRMLVNAGIPVNSQTVLLRGVNDDEDILLTLFHKLQKVKVRPYYLFHCDPVRGTVHFSTPIQRGVQIIKNLLLRTSPFAVPYYAIDHPDIPGKLLVSPETIVSVDADHVLLRYYDGSVLRVGNTGW